MRIDIINGYLIDPESGVEGYRDIRIKDDKIEAIAKTGGLPMSLASAHKSAKSAYEIRFVSMYTALPVSYNSLTEML